MSDVVKRNPMSPLTELFDWFNSGWPAIADWPHDGARALLAELGAGELSYAVEGRRRALKIDGGWVEVANDHLRVLAATAEKTGE